MEVQSSFFDTHSSIKELMAAGVDEQQAETHVRLLTALVTQSLATKSDLKDLRREMDIRFTKQDAEIKLLKWMAGTALALGFVNLGIVLRILIILPG